MNQVPTTAESVRFLQPTYPPIINRDSLLDFCKGVGILLVVWGHTLQANVQFDEIPAFRMLYSFHMPLFAFLAGASARHWSQKLGVQNTAEAIAAASTRIRRAAIQLILPFFIWSLISYRINAQQEPLGSYLVKVMIHPDYGLWFLPCIFWCTVYLTTGLTGLAICRARLEKASRFQLSRHLSSPYVQAAIIFVVWLAMRTRVPGGFGLTFANTFHLGLFMFFLMGMLFFKPYVEIRKPYLRALPYIVFLLLAPFWHRTLPGNMVAGAPEIFSFRFWRTLYPLLVAVSGSLMVIDMARLVHSLGLTILNRCMLYLGTASLAVYALHFHFLGYRPPILAPVALSLITYWLLVNIPVVRTVLFGKLG
ncbi:acyltransferase family protein [Herbaspirillum sp. YR522]|uniref:acyltransferase family protein n=1 Tax=Herbaspirillum sp. YR522 TaxID=1144342 RepID=UPI00026F76D0|nr:acyltransferase family protein [Herbaspirillum sp. YR522]EJN01231.1 acetyltransferase, fucose-4-O-acetylase [Herbaspirillum sp. YR522]